VDCRPRSGSWAPDGLKIGTGRGKWEAEDFTGLVFVGLDGTLFRDRDVARGLGAGIVEDISWSPDGKYALVSYRASRWGGYLALFEVDAEAQAFSPKQAVSDFKDHPDGLDYCQSSWSPDGKRVVFVSGGPYHTSECAGHLYVADADLSNVTPLIEGDGLFGSPSWSPDGRSIVFVKAREVRGQEAEGPSPGPPESIWIINSDGTHLRRLVGGDEYKYNRPVWQPLLQEP
jgi:Tol biopolymer transport system component